MISRAKQIALIDKFIAQCESAVHCPLVDAATRRHYAIERDTLLAVREALAGRGAPVVVEAPNAPEPEAFQHEAFL